MKTGRESWAKATVPRGMAMFWQRGGDRTGAYRREQVSRRLRDEDQVRGANVRVGQEADVMHSQQHMCCQGRRRQSEYGETQTFHPNTSLPKYDPKGLLEFCESLLTVCTYWRRLDLQ